MPAQLSQSAKEILATLAEYRLLTMDQLARLLQRHPRTARDHVLRLDREGLIHTQPGMAGTEGTRGRPVKVLSLTAAAVEALRTEGMFDGKVAAERLIGTAIHCVRHQLLLNSFRIQLQELQATNPQFTVRFLSSNSPFILQGTGGQPRISDRVEISKSEDVTFVPDGVFSVTHSSRQKTLLFFLEVDRGTESLVASKRGVNDIRHKVITYQSYFRAGGYKRYKQIFDAPLNGFRLLFLTNTSGRLATLCGFVASRPPNDFIWLTEQNSMSSRGPAAAIWVRGGRTSELPQSILGNEVPPIATLGNT